MMSAWVAVLSLPMLAGKWLAGPVSDQHAAGFAFRTWAAGWWRRLGHVPLWDPEMFGGLPFVAAQHGDIFYPVSFLRLWLSMPAVMNLSFVLHYVLAGLFVYLLLRLLEVSWTASVVGGLGYQLSGLIASYPLPGHDGKLYVSTLLPLAMVGLVLALKRRRPQGYAILASAVGLALLSPQYQLAYYLLIASGLFALYLTFGDAERQGERKYVRLGLALAAVLLGFGVAALQIWPFLHYLPFSPRSEGMQGGFEAATSYATPWAHIPELAIKHFTGDRGSYWGPNGLKLHSEYLGLPLIALAILGVLAPARRRLALWLAGIGFLLLLVSMGSATPFYRLWWLLPYVKQTRAPGMAFYVVALMLAMLAGLGMERIERGEGRAHPIRWLIASGVIAVLGIVGAFGAMGRALAEGVVRDLATRHAAAGTQMDPARAEHILSAATANGTAAMVGALTGAVALALVAVMALWFWKGKLKPIALALGLAATIGGDLFVNARPFWSYSDLHKTLFAPDSVTAYISARPLPHRTLDLGVYPSDGVSLMAFNIPQVLGHHMFELHRYDQLLGGQGRWENLMGRGAASIRMWDLLAVRFVVAPVQLDSLPGFRRVLSSATTNARGLANLFERLEPPPYVRVVPAAVKVEPERMASLLLSPDFDYDRLLLLDATDTVTLAPVTRLPEPSPSRATVEFWQPGRMAIVLEPTPGEPAWVMVAENWYPDWRATVDGKPVQAHRGNLTYIVVPVAAGTRRIELDFTSADYQQGKAVTFASLACILLIAVVPSFPQRKRPTTNGEAA